MTHPMMIGNIYIMIIISIKLILIIIWRSREVLLPIVLLIILQNPSDPPDPVTENDLEFWVLNFW
jgi:hypothetical protein